MTKKYAEYIRIPRKLFYVFLVSGIVALIYWSLRPEFAPVDLGEVSKGTFRQVIVDEGVSYFKNRYTISAPADGITPNLNIEVGDRVQKGEVIFKFLWDRGFEMKSPVSGFVLRVFEKDRRHVVRGTPILEVGDPNSLEIHSKILSEEVIDVKVGQKVIVSNWGKEEPLEAEVIKIEPTAEEEVSALGVKEQRVNVHMKLTSKKELWQELGDGFRVEVSIIVNEVNEAKLIPVGALFSSDGQPAVYVYRDKKVHLTPVQIGHQNREFAQLQSDLFPGTQVVLYPGSSLNDGDKATPRKK